MKLKDLVQFKKIPKLQVSQNSPDRDKYRARIVSQTLRIVYGESHAKK